MLVGYYIEQHGGQVRYYDEHTGDTEPNREWTEVYLIGYWEDYVTNYINGAHEHSVIIDPWRKLENQFHCPVIHYGNTRKKKT
jgi:hypothetical protein